MIGLRSLLGPRRAGVEHIAFGTFCHAASALRGAGLRTWSGPFDWLFSCPGMIADCLEDDFAALLDPRHLRSVPAAELSGGVRKQCRHLLFEARYGLPPVFNHHDPAGVPADARALERAVRRLRRALGRPGANVLYMAFDGPAKCDGMDRVRREVARCRATNTLVAIGLVPAPARSERCVRIDRDGVPTVEIELRTLGRSQGAAFPDPEDDRLLQAALLAAPGAA